MAGWDLLSQSPFFSSSIAYAFEYRIVFCWTRHFSRRLSHAPLVSFARFLPTSSHCHTITKRLKLNSKSNLLCKSLHLIELVRFIYSELKWIAAGLFILGSLFVRSFSFFFFIYFLNLIWFWRLSLALYLSHWFRLKKMNNEQWKLIFCQV